MTTRRRNWQKTGNGRPGRDGVPSAGPTSRPSAMPSVTSVIACRASCGHDLHHVGHGHLCPAGWVPAADRSGRAGAADVFRDAAGFLVPVSSDLRANNTSFPAERSPSTRRPPTRSTGRSATPPGIPHAAGTDTFTGLTAEGGAHRAAEGAGQCPTRAVGGGDAGGRTELPHRRCQRSARPPSRRRNWPAIWSRPIWKPAGR